MTSFQYIVAAVITQYILGLTSPLSLQLQTKSCELVKAHKEARNLLGVLDDVRINNHYYNKLYNHSEGIAKSVGVEPTTPRLTARQQ